MGIVPLGIHVNPAGRLAHSKLAVSDKGPVGPKHGERLRNRVCLSTMAVERATPSPPQSDSATACESGNHRALPKRGGNGAALRQLSIHPLKERRCPETSDQSKLLCSHLTLQDGGNSYPQKPTADWLVKIDLKDAYFSIPISQFPSRAQSFPVQLPPLWPHFSSIIIYTRMT